MENPGQPNFESFEMEKWNIPIDRAQWVDGKIGSFVLLSCLLPELWSLKFKMAKMVHFLYFLLITANNQS